MRLKLVLIVPILLVLLLPAPVAHADGLPPIQRLGTGAPTTLAAAPDGSAVAVGATIGVWFLNPVTLQPVSFLDTQAQVDALRYSPDTHYLRVNDRVYDLTAAAWTDLDPATVTWLDPRCTVDGRYCIVEQWHLDAVYGRWIVDMDTTIETQLLSRFVRQFAWAHDGQTFYAILYRNEIVTWPFQPRLTVPPTSAELTGFFTPHPVSPDWSADGALLQTGGRYGGGDLWDVASGRPLAGRDCGYRTYQHLDADCAWPTARLYVSRDLYLYDDVRGFQSRHFIPHHIATAAYAESAGGQHLVTSGPDNLSYFTRESRWGESRVYSPTVVSTRLWDRQSLSALGSLPVLFFETGLTPNADLVIGKTETALEAWEWQTGQRRWSLPLYTYPTCTWYTIGWCHEYPRNLVVSPTGAYVAVAGASLGTDILLLRADTGELVTTLTGHTGFIQGLAFSPDGARLAAGSADGTVLIWQVP
jgi:WD40 repeat protein